MVEEMGLRRSTPLPLFAVVAAVLVGCGGTDDGLSKEQLIAKGDAICEQARGVAPTPPQTRDFAAIARYESEVVRGSRATLAKLRALKPQGSEQKIFERFLARAQRRLDDEIAVLDAADRGDAQAVTAAVAKERGQDGPATRQAAEQVGFRICESAA